MGAAQAVAAVVIGEIGGPAVVDNDAAVAGDDASGLHRFLPALRMQAFQRDVATGADVDPVVLPVDPQGRLIDVHRGHGQQLLDGRLLPALERPVEL